MKHYLLTLFLALPCAAAMASDPPCSADAADRAKKLLVFHIGDQMEDRLGFESPRPLPSMKNPANPKQKFEVLEVLAHVSPRGEYRMRLIYYMLPRGCILIGEEILQFANL